MNVNLPEDETEDAIASLLELAANNDLEAFQKYADHEPSIIDEIGLWYGRQKGSNQMVLEQRTPLMVAATYGSINVLKLIISLPQVDVNRLCGNDQNTPLHCAALGGSVNAIAIDTVKILLEAGADPHLRDASGRRPIDVIVVPPKFEAMKYSIQMMLTNEAFLEEGRLSTSNSNSPPKFNDILEASTPERKEYRVDPSLPDIKNSIYSTDEFRMFSFKIRPCSRAYSHDWTECPFVHPGENARRRDPRKYHYSCVPCPDFRKGACRRGDTCEYAHGVFECWLHPAQYRTRLCKDGTSCNRRVCFFAHTHEELRPLYVSTGSAVPSPRSGANVMDFTQAMSFLPGSPSAGPIISPSPFTPPMSPSTNGIQNMGPWGPQQNVLALHLPESNNLQSSRLRSSFNARDIHPEELSLFQDVDLHLLSEMSFLSPQQNVSNRNARQKALTPSNLDDNFSYGVPSPGIMSPCGVDPISPMSARLSMLARHNLGSNGEKRWSNWAAPTGQPECAVTGSEMGGEPDLSWVQSLVKESPQDVKEKFDVVAAGAGTSYGEDADLSSSQIEQVDQSVLGAWLEQMKLDQLMAQ